MNLATQKLDIMDRLMKVDEQKTLHQVDELLIAAEMKARTEESMQAIREGRVISLEQFEKDTKEWLRARRAMK